MAREDAGILQYEAELESVSCKEAFYIECCLRYFGSQDPIIVERSHIFDIGPVCREGEERYSDTLIIHTICNCNQGGV